jgi:uncharacterized protein
MSSAVLELALPKIIQCIATELAVKPQQISATVALLDEGSSVPFIARYRKEQTGNLDDTQLRNLEERLAYLRELEQRRAAILAARTCVALDRRARRKVSAHCSCGR